MKLFCLVLVIYVVALTLFGVDGRGGGTTNGLEEPKFVGLFQRARRHVPGINRLHEGLVANEPPPPPKIRSRRDALEEILVANENPPPPPQFRPRRQAPPGMPPPPDGMPPPPDGMPPPPQFLL
ncbi:amyloid beta A4 precursor protein-binding family B member 1-interacting protein [Drosophila bipectinata]|uniref:amyloid beta A4 precursor protein-binding family B member 1-interacting protein n=1 Tax=Drosophila bipectinata TaxID=42026 RepID=UPI001C8A5327|nr:vasodilator-stimulated phosphoprotein [Drosophila bipectinata]